MFRTTRPFALLVAVCLLAVSALPVLAAAPANDDIGSPIVITAIPYSNTQDTSEATTDEDNDPYCWGQGPTVWYSFTPAEDIRLEANTFGSDYDTTLLAAVDDGEGGLDVIACNDDSGSLQSRIRFNASEGVTYLFMAGAYDSGPGGEVVFNLFEAPPGQPLSLDLSVDTTSSFHRDGTATIRGTLTCTGADYVELYGELSQQVGRFRISGSGWDYLECDPDGAVFELHIWGYSGSFAGGRATAWVEAWACDDDEDDCDVDFVQTTVRLRR